MIQMPKAQRAVVNQKIKEENNPMHLPVTINQEERETYLVRMLKVRV
jgi:hypothetical protein